MLLDVVEAEGEDFDDYLKEDLGPGLFFRIFHGSNSMNSMDSIYSQLVNWSSGRLADLEAGFLFGGLLGEPASGEGLLAMGGDEDTAFTVFREVAAVEAYAGSSGDLDEDRQGAFETRRVRDLHSVDECGDEVVGVFEGVADIVETFDEEAGTLVVVMRNSVQLAVNGFARIRFGTNRRKVISD